MDVKDRQQRPTLGTLGRGHRVEVHYRVWVGCYEGLAWERLFMHLMRVREKTHLVAIRPQQKRSLGGGDATAAGDGTKYTPFCCQERNQEKAEAPKTVLVEGEGVQRSFLFKKSAVEFYKVRSWHIDYSEHIGRKSIMRAMKGRVKPSS